ncbi:MAG: LamG-like jellyroll fold domain-containing protein, partial [Bacteroidota bacterium]
TFDLHEWMVFSGNMNDEGGGHPAPGEVLHFGDVLTSGSPIKKLPETDKSFTETYRSYLLPNWSGQFHFGGLAPAKALKLGAKASYSCAPDRGMTLQTSQDSFTFECLVKTNQNGGVIWSIEDRDSDQFQFVGLDNGELGWSSGNDGSFEKMAVPQLFDDQWHLLSMRYDRSYAQSEDAWVHVYVDGEPIGFGLASSQQLANRSPIRMGGLANPNDPTDRQLELAHVRFWAYQRSDDQIKAAQHQLPTGEELGLAAYWPLDNEELIDLGPDKLNLSAPYPAHFTDYPNPSFTNKGGLKGILAEVRIWNTALSKEYLRKSLFTPLVGREYRLAGNWRMGAIWEEEKKITDFSTQGNDGQVYGDVYLSPDSLRRRLGPTETAPLATTYRNEELVAVSARAIYEETLEFRLVGQDGKPVRNNRMAGKAFHFHFRGKKGRSSKKWIGHERFVSGIISEHIGESINPNARQGDKDFGWYRAKCRFVVPDKVALLRVLGLHEVDGDWQRMEIRRHRLTHISEAISHVVYQNVLDDLSTIGEAPVDTRKSRGLIRFFQNQIVSYRERLALLEDWIKKAENDTFSFQQEVNKAEKAKDDAKNRLDQLKREWDNLHKNREILLTYKYRIKVKHSNKYLTLPRFYDPYRGLLSGYTPITQNNTHGRIADFVIEQADHKNQFHLRLADSENRYLAGLLNLPTIKEAKGSSLFAQTGRNSVVTKFGFAGSNFEFSSSSSKFQFFYGHSWADNLSSLETVKAAGTKAYRINVEETGLAVDITGSQKKNGAKCIQWTYNSPPSDNQFFYIEIQEGSSISPEVQSVQRAKAEAEQAYTIALNKYNTLKNQPRDKINLESWIAERNELVAKIADAYIQISSSDENYKSAITELKALTLPPLSSDDPNELITKGAYLGFVEAKDQLFLYENCEGEVQLCYGDRFGRIRQTKYDVTADSRNPYFEEWVPDGPKLALKLERDNSLIPKTKFQLGSEFTIEWWVNCQATHWEGDGDNNGGLLDLLKTEDGTALPTLTNRALGFEILSQKEKTDWNQLFVSFRRSDREGEVYPLGHLGDLSEGWHHIGFVKKGTGPDVVAELYVDGELRFNSRQFIGSLFEEMPREQRDDFRKRFKEYYTFLDGAGQQDIVELGSTFVEGSQFELAELRIWTLALDAEEIAANSKVELSGNELGLLAYYKMNEGIEGTNIEIRNFAHGNEAYNLTLKGHAKWVPFDPTIGGLNRKVTYFPNPRTIGHWLAPKATMQLHTANEAKVYQLGRISFWTKLDQRMGHSRLISIHNGENMLEFALVIGPNGEVSLNSSSRGQGIPMSVPFYFGSWVQVTLNQVNRSHLEIYFDGKLAGTSFALRLPQVEGVAQSTEADKLRIEFGWQRGEMAQFAIYDRPAEQIWIEANYRANIDPVSNKNGTSAGLVAYFPMDQEPNEENQLVNLVDADRPLQFQDNYQPSLHRTIDLPIATVNTVSNEYHTVTIDQQTGEKRAMLRRFFAMPDQNGLQLYANKRIEELELLWVGNAQFK